MPESPRTLSDLIRRAAQEENDRVVEKIVSTQERIVTTTFDKGATYTTVVIFGGYAGIFAIWQLTKEYLSKGEMLWSALLILISMLSFVLFEVFKMVSVSRITISKSQALEDPSNRRDPHKLIQALQEIERNERNGIGPSTRIWAISVAISVLGGLGGAAILVYAFIAGLLAA